MKKSCFLRIIPPTVPFALLLILPFLLPRLAGSEQPAPNSVRTDNILERMRPSFVANRGQLEGDVAFYVPGKDRTFYFTSKGVTVALVASDASAEQCKRWAAKLEFEAARLDVEPRGAALLQGRVNFFKGAPGNWKTGIPTFGELIYPNLWPGVDLVFTGDGDQVKYRFVLDPGAQPDTIRLRWSGACSVKVDDEGALVVETPLGNIVDDAPTAWQDIDGQRIAVRAAYVFAGDIAPGQPVAYGFKIDSYDTTRPLIIDPALLVYCGFVGGAGRDYPMDIAVDDTGCAYVTGWTDSAASTFPVAAGPDLSFNGGSCDAFVAKIAADGSSLVYCGYIGGDQVDMGNGIAVDSQGRACVTGSTNSEESTFPVVIGPDLTFNGSGGPWWQYGDAFVARLSADGTVLEYCGYIGGQGYELGNDIDVDPAGRVFVTGWTESPETSFPVKIGPDLTSNGASDAFVARVSSDGSGLDYCGYVGGTSGDEGIGIAVDAAGRACLAGAAMSDENSFPVAVGPDLTHNGAYDAFVAQVNPEGTALTFCGYIGGSLDDFAYGAGVDAAGNVYAAGAVDSDETSFPVTVGPDLTWNGLGDAFVARISADGTALQYCGYIGSGVWEAATDMAVDADGHAYVTGWTESDQSGFPVKVGPDLTFNGGNHDIFVARVGATGADLDYCGFIGGAGIDCGEGIAVDSEGAAYVVGMTDSDETSLPVTTGPDLTYNSGSWDAVAAKVPPYHVLLRSGGVRYVSGNQANVFFVNGTAGQDASRKVVVPPGMGITFSVGAPPQGPVPANFTLYMIVGEAGPDDLTVQPFSLGIACFPTPLSNGHPWRPPLTVINNIGFPFYMGNPVFPLILPAPVAVGPASLQPGTYTMQGFIHDFSNPAHGMSLSNAIVLEVQ